MKSQMIRSTEHDIQSAFFAWVQLYTTRYPELALMFAVPNGGMRDKRQDEKGRWFSPTAVKLKREGVKPGIPDIFLPCARGGSHGLFIEMKAPDGSVSREQRRVHKQLREQGYAVGVCFSLESAITLLTWYLLDHPLSEDVQKGDRRAAHAARKGKVATHGEKVPESTSKPLQTKGGAA